MVKVMSIPKSEATETMTEAPKVAAAIVRGVSKKFGKTTILDDINFEVAEGEALVLLGASGSGKTTILRIIAGLEEPDAGQVILHGREVTELPARERGVGRPLAAADEPRAAFDTELDVAHRLVVLRLARQARHFGRALGGEADLQFLDALDDLGERRVVNRVVQIDAARRIARLAGDVAEVHAAHHTVGHFLGRRVLAGDQRILAAQFQRQRLQRGAAAGHD